VHTFSHTRTDSTKFLDTRLNGIGRFKNEKTKIMDNLLVKKPAHAKSLAFQPVVQLCLVALVTLMKSGANPTTSEFGVVVRLNIFALEKNSFFLKMCSTIYCVVDFSL
jgi:hypothetical protein